MKLSKKINIIQAIALIIAIILCIMFDIGFTNGTKKGDLIRVTEISKGVRGRLELKENELTYLSELYAGLYQEGQIRITNTIKNNPKLNNFFSVNSLDFQGIYNISSGRFTSFYGNDNTSWEVKSKLLTTINGETENIKLIEYSESFYLCKYKLINSNNYVILIKQIDEGFLNDLGSSTNSIVYFVNNPELNNINQRIVKDEIEYLTIEKKDKISTLSKIGYSPDNIYFVLEQENQVQSTISKGFKTFMIVMFSLIILSNLFIYIIIKKVLVKRIVNLNNSICTISKYNNYTNRLELDSKNDEISNLCVSINEMLTNVESAKNKIKYSEKKYHNIINSMTNGFIFVRSIYDNDGNIINGEIIDMNSAAKVMLRLKKFQNIKLTDLLKNNKQLATNVILNLCKLKNNTQLILDKEIELYNNTWGMITLNRISVNNFFIIINDVTKIKMYSENMKFFANYDTLTGIYNRRKIIDYLNELKKGNREFSFYFIDLDNFKGLNDTLGHEEGDKLLQAVAKSLTSIENESVKIGRFGGDEFVIVNEGDIRKNYISKFANVILDAINKTYVFDKFTYNLEASIGISAFPADSYDVNEIIKYADIAMYNSKMNGKNIVSVFEKEMFNKHELENKIKEAIKNGEFIPYFQPIFNVKEKKVDGLEALVRWVNGNEVLSPSSFLEIARRSNVLYNIDKVMIEEVCKFSKLFYKKFQSYISISINVSNSLLTKKEFVDFIINKLQEYSIPPEYINIEITEEEIIRDMNYIVSILNHLRKFGIKVSLDDFGTGYSTYSYINLLPLDIMKIDKTLVQGIEKHEKNYSVVKSLIDLSRSLNLEIICEGVESEEQLKLLTNFDCRRIQGYYFSKPKSIDEVLDYVEKINFSKDE